MAERLTEKVFDNNGKQQDIYEWSSASSLECNKKLGMLEDIMEKYGIESLEELDNALEFAKVIEKTLSEYGIKDNEELEELLDDNKYAQNVVVKQLVEPQNAKTDRDTWKRACELASETLKQVMGKPLWIGGNIPTPEVKDSDYFYQQAKKGGRK